MILNERSLWNKISAPRSMQQMNSPLRIPKIWQEDSLSYRSYSYFQLMFFQFPCLKIFDMINADLTEVLKDYRDWDFVVRRKFLNYANKMINDQGSIVYKGIVYRLPEDLKVDLDAECLEESDVNNPGNSGAFDY